MDDKKGLTITIVFEAESANYGEGIGNITALKKMSRNDGNMYTYISRQALRYNIVEQMGINTTPVSAESGVVQFSPSAKIEDCPEIDLFGYMKTHGKSDDGDAGGAQTRSAVVRLSNAVSMEPFNSDLDFLTNMGLARRGDEKGKAIDNNIAQSEIHHAMYCYTVCIDLDRVGEDGDISLPNAEKSKRVCELLEALQFLYRDIKGRRESFAPVFMIGGVYQRKCPYYEGRCHLLKNKLDVQQLKQIINSCGDTKENTLVGQVCGQFANTVEIQEEIGAVTIEEVFTQLRKKVEAYYA